MHMVTELDVPRAVRAHIAGKPVLLAWIRALGVNPADVSAFRVFADGDGTVEFDCFERDAEGRFYLAGEEPAMRVERRALTTPVPATVLSAAQVR